MKRMRMIHRCPDSPAQIKENYSCLLSQNQERPLKDGEQDQGHEGGGNPQAL